MLFTRHSPVLYQALYQMIALAAESFVPGFVPDDFPSWLAALYQAL